MIGVKTFLQRLRKLETDVVCVDLLPTVTFDLVKIIKLFISIEYKDFVHCAYYGDHKNLIAIFVRTWEVVMDNAVNKADAVEHYTKQEYLDILEQTINIQAQKQVFFGRELLPVNTPEEKLAYDDMNDRYNDFNDRLLALKAKSIEMAERYYPKATIKADMKASLAKMNKLFEYTCLYMASLLSSRLPDIKSSLKEIHRRLRKNFEAIQEENKHKRDELLETLYIRGEERKQMLKEKCYEADDTLAQIMSDENDLKSALEKDKRQTSASIEILKDELDFWKKKMDDVDEIEKHITRIKKERDYFVKVDQQQKKSRCSMPGLMKTCYAGMSKKIAMHKASLERKLNEANWCLITHFAVKGFNRKFLMDKDIGPYTLNSFMYKVYFLDGGHTLRMYKTDGTFIDVPSYNDIPYYYDDYGRYHITESGEKIYQLGASRSCYKLDEYNVLQRTDSATEHMRVKDPIDVQVLPAGDDVNIRETLSSEVVKYLWECFGAVLPEALAEVEKRRPKNPIHYLAHQLVTNKYRKLPKNKMNEQLRKVQRYREEILQKREDKFSEALKTWKSKQFKRCNDLDDTEQWQTYNAQLGTMEFLNLINTDFFYNNIQ